MENIKFELVTDKVSMKWKIITYCGSFWMAITDYREGYIQYSSLWKLNVTSMKQDWDLYYLSVGNDELWVVYANWKTIPIDELYFYRDFYWVELSSTIPNLKKICADFHSEKLIQSKAISSVRTPDELMDFDESISDDNSTPLVRSPEISRPLSDEAILQSLERHWIHTSSDISLLLSISFEPLTPELMTLWLRLLERAHRTTANQRQREKLETKYGELMNLF